MRLLTISLLATILIALSGCSRDASRSEIKEETRSAAPREASAPNTTAAEQRNEEGSATSASSRGTAGGEQAQFKKVSLEDPNQQPTAPTERKIIRNANLSIETDNPTESQRRVSAIAEAKGGFVVTTDAKQQNAEGQLKPVSVVTVTVRVPAAQFAAVLDEIRGTGARVSQEKITGQDVTEEFIDIEARIRTQKALEAQFMEIMKQARTVSDALEVQRQISVVRTEIERHEGRRRFLENQSSLSTITVTFQPPTQIVSTAGFFYSVKRAFGEGLDAAATITLFFVQAIVTLLPILLFIFLPIGLLLRYILRRFRRAQMARQLAREPQTVPPTQ
jgi:hypothetical protein